MANTITGQVGILNIAGVASFGVTKIEAKRNYVNADTTVTQNNWEQFLPIVRGCVLDVTVPLLAGLGAWIDKLFDSAGYTGGASNGIACSLTSTPAAGETFTGTGLIENYTVSYDAKDAARLILTIKFTGSVTIGP